MTMTTKQILIAARGQLAMTESEHFGKNRYLCNAIEKVAREMGADHEPATELVKQAIGGEHVFEAYIANCLGIKNRMDDILDFETLQKLRLALLNGIIDKLED